MRHQLQIPTTHPAPSTWQVLAKIVFNFLMAGLKNCLQLCGLMLGQYMFVQRLPPVFIINNAPKSHYFIARLIRFAELAVFIVHTDLRV